MIDPQEAAKASRIHTTSIADHHIVTSRVPSVALFIMDLPYDQTSDDTFGVEATANQTSTLEEDLQEAYRAFSATPWGSRIGGFLGNVVKQVGCFRSAG